MKKFLLAAAAVALACGASFAETYTFDVSTANTQLNANTFTGSQVLELGDANWTLDVVKGNANYYFGKDSNGKGLQIGSSKQYAKEVTLSTEDFSEYNIESVSFELSMASKGTWAGSISVGDKSTDFSLTTSVATYTLEDINVTGGKIELALTSTASALYIKSVTVVYSEGASDLLPADLSFGDVTEFEVKYPNGTFTAPTLDKKTDAAVVYTSSDESVATVAGDGAVTILKPGTTVITAKCEATDTYAAGSAKYTLTVFAAAANLKELATLSEEDPKGSFMIDCPLTVTYVNGVNVYLMDAAGDATLLYGSTTDYKAGDVLAAGWMVTYSPYNGLPEYKVSGDLPEVTESDVTFDVPEVTLAEVNESYINKLFVITDLHMTKTIPATKTNIDVTDGDATLAFRNNFGLAEFTPDPTKKYSVKGILGVYNGTLQFYPIEYNVASGVAAVEAVAGEAKYFDLNGRQVKGQLQNGLYIKVLNGKASKVIVK